jgi:Zn-dependent peptidase ImmA (M78 family)/DNA-binding XRE family transcriptional regulator
MGKDNVVNFKQKLNINTESRLAPERLREAREAMILNQSELADLVGVSRQAISAFEQGLKTPEPETLSRIAKALKQPISFFIAPELPVFGAMSTRFFRATGSNTKRRNLMCDVLAKWFVQVTRYLEEFVNFPATDVPDFTPNGFSEEYSNEEIELAAEQCRKFWGLGSGPISNVVSLMESKGIFICRLEVPEKNIDAFSFWNGGRPFVFLSSCKDSPVRLRYDAAHELGHLVLHKWVDRDEIYDKERLKVIEKEANLFAAAFLLPRKTFVNEVYTSRIYAFVELKRRWKVAIQAMIMRCKTLGVFDEDQVVNLYKQISKKGWRKNEPLDRGGIIALEHPKMLCKAMRLVTKKVKSAEDVVVDMSHDPRTLEILCGLEWGEMSPKKNISYEVRLKE